MTILQNEDIFKIGHGIIKTHDLLPIGTYHIQEDHNGELYLVKREDLKADCKIYGDYANKAPSVYKTYLNYPKSMGVLLCGANGTGKTLFAKKLCELAKNYQMPVILVDRQFDGLTAFIDSIKQEAVVLFDEFDKTMVTQTFRGSECDPKLLSLLDGTSMNKKLFIFTVNNSKLIGEHLINRPNRLHYKFNFTIPSISEINEYLCDSIDKDKQTVIPEILEIAVRIPLNYDALRAIAFEINHGNDLDDSLYDLNINYSDTLIYDVEVFLSNDFNTLTNNNVEIDFYAKTAQFFTSYDYGNEQYRVCINLQNAYTDIESDTLIIPKEDINVFNTSSSKRYPTVKYAQLKLKKPN